MPKPKKPKAQFPNKLTVVHKNLLLKPKGSAYGHSYDEEALIELDPHQPPKDYLDTLLHETFHVIFPGWEESEVFDIAAFFTDILWDNGYRKTYQEDGDTVHDISPGGQFPVTKYKKQVNIPPPNKSTSYPRIKEDYEEMFKKCKVKDPETVDKIIDQIIAQQDKYKAVGIAPWYWIGCIHRMESNQSFTKHLHNGDSLRHRTKNVPSGRPKAAPDTIHGYSWDFSAKDALRLKGLDKWGDWSIPGMLYQAERYNGWGYRMYKSNHSPYLWSGSQYWERGKYVKDGKYDPSATSSQIGVGVILKRMKERKIFV
jgi:lysozyme family protein